MVGLVTSAKTRTTSKFRRQVCISAADLLQWPSLVGLHAFAIYLSIGAATTDSYLLIMFLWYHPKGNLSAAGMPLLDRSEDIGTDIMSKANRPGEGGFEPVVCIPLSWPSSLPQEIYRFGFLSLSAIQGFSGHLYISTIDEMLDSTRF